mmetsp:Transcript_127518/g.271887  ORF Transcript_127518/g.271887 Transcript_127518/m.271887 type:complete len:511 (+) Transcript_127518:47-1579(+)
MGVVVEAALADAAMEDLMPLAKDARPWRWYTFVALWVAMCVQPVSYSFGGALAAFGLGYTEALGAAAVGSLITVIALIVNSVPGVTYGIPFPVYARSAFGMQGAKYAAFSRGVVAVFWLSFQMWLGADSLFQGLARLAPGIKDWAPLWPPYLNGAQLLLLLFTALLHVAVIAAGLQRFDTLSYVMAPLCVAFFALVVAWSVTPSWGQAGLGVQLHEEGDESAGVSAWIAGINATVSLWSTLMLNMADISRLAPRQQDQVVGQLVGMPIPSLCAFAVGVLGSAAVQTKSGATTTSWVMADLFPYWSPSLCVLAGTLIMVSNLVVNVGANIIPPANDFMNLNPTGFRWRWCAYSTVALAVLACPFYLFHTATGFVSQFLGGYGMVTGAIYGVMVADYYVVRQRHLVICDLYPANLGEGACSYWHGHNWRAGIATLAGISLPMPSWIAGLAGLPSLSAFWCVCENASWFVACAIAAAVYIAACRASPPKPMGAEVSEHHPSQNQVKEAAQNMC